jgi:hypothetical protein
MSQRPSVMRPLMDLLYQLRAIDEWIRSIGWAIRMQHKVTNSWNIGVSVTVTAPMFLFLSTHFATSLGPLPLHVSCDSEACSVLMNAMQRCVGTCSRISVELILYFTNQRDSVEIPKRCSFVIEFIIPKFFKVSTYFEWHTAYHQELQPVFAASGLYARKVTGRCQGWVGSAHSALAVTGHHMGI